ncbi:MAG: hypothetical protein WCF44_01785, partial [Candidatus Methylophosphatis roskildensis]
MARSPSDWKRDSPRALWPAARGPLVVVLVSLLVGCGTAPRHEAGTSTPSSVRVERARAQEIVLRTLALIDTGYVFGGRNPEAGLD